MLWWSSSVSKSLVFRWLMIFMLATSCLERSISFTITFAMDLIARTSSMALLVPFGNLLLHT